MELAYNHPDAACSDWRQSLLGSAKHDYLPDMVATSAALGAKGLTTEQWTKDVLPDQPELVKEAARLLHPDAADAKAREPFLELALRQLEHRPGGMKPTDYHLLALVQEELGQSDEAWKSYNLALSRDPRQAAWRLEMARLLIRLKKYKEAEDALRDAPMDDKVLDLLTAARAGQKEKK
jgi:tetratricopeptide (TPR) repeat protein